MRSIFLLLVLLGPQALHAVTIEVPLTGLDGFYANGDLRVSGFEFVSVPEGELLVGMTLRLEGVTACGNSGCIPPVNFTWGSTQLSSEGGEFSFELSLTGFEPQILGPVLRVGTFLRLGVGITGSGFIPFNGFFGAAAGDQPPAPQLSSPAIVTSATLVIVTAPVPEPGLGSLVLTALLAIVSRRFARL